MTNEIENLCKNCKNKRENHHPNTDGELVWCYKYAGTEEFKPKNLNVPKNIYKEPHCQDASSREVKGSSGELNHPDTQTPQTTKNNNDDLLMNKGRPLNNNKETAGKTLSDKIVNTAEIYIASDFLYVEDVNEAIKILREAPLIYWECNECKTMWIYGNEPKICSCGNDIFANSTKRKIIRFEKIDAIFGEGLSNG